MQTLPFQRTFRPALPNVYGASDYREFSDTLSKIDEMLVKSGLEDALILAALNQHVVEQQLVPEDFFNSKKASLAYKQFKHALRCNIARHLSGESYRAFSVRLADSTLFQWFTDISAFGVRKAISKSTLERHEKLFDEKIVADVIRQSMAKFSDSALAHDVGLNEAISFKAALMDSTCVKANIHFPVDWVLFRDAARSLLLAIKTIRAHGLKNRMIEPAELLKQMNKLCINMTHTRRRKDSKKKRKSIFRDMKKLMKIIEKHAQRYHRLLSGSWVKTGWSEAQMQQVLKRIDNILEQLPQAIKQAHERIIGERKLKSCEKLFSFYDHDAQIMVRGKSGSEVEFGQRLLLAEQKDGLIVDWKLFSKDSPNDSHLLKASIERIESYFGKLDSATTDRGFTSKENTKFLEENKIYNATCPRSPAELKERLEDSVFASLQTRRSQTEGRIGIFKNAFLGRPLRSQILLNKQHAVNWCVLTHNLWVLARKALSDEASALKKAA